MIDAHICTFFLLYKKLYFALLSLSLFLQRSLIKKILPIVKYISPRALRFLWRNPLEITIIIDEQNIYNQCNSLGASQKVYV